MDMTDRLFTGRFRVTRECKRSSQQVVLEGDVIDNLACLLHIRTMVFFEVMASRTNYLADEGVHILLKIISGEFSLLLHSTGLFPRDRVATRD